MKPKKEFIMKKLIVFAIIVTLIASVFGCARTDTADEEVYLLPDKEESEGETPTTPETEDKKEDKQPTPQKVPSDEPVVQDKPEIEQTTTENKEPEQQQAEQKPPIVQEPAKVPDYNSFICRSYKKIKWKQVRFTNDADVTLQFEIPKDWVISKSSVGFNISRDETIIGTLSVSKPNSPTSFYDTKTLYVPEYNIFRSYQANWYHTDDGDSMTRVFEFITNRGTKTIQMFLSVNYIELDDNAKAHLEESALTVPKAVVEYFPDLSETNGSKRFLLLGNSFINSSHVHTFLRDMLRDSGYSLTTVARGNAQVYTFSEDPTICEQIRSGAYAYVFVGCFYGDGSIPAVKTLLDCANESNTKIVIFPAHNESSAVFDTAMDMYDGLALLNWKEEINSLIDSGVDKWVLCVDDTYQHSTVYAGYVGAHMIYRKVFKKIPPVLSNAPLSQAQVDGILTGYANSLHTPEPPKEIAFNGIEYKI